MSRRQLPRWLRNRTAHSWHYVYEGEAAPVGPLCRSFVPFVFLSWRRGDASESMARLLTLC